MGRNWRVVIVLVGCGLVLAGCQTAAEKYRATQDPVALYAVLYREVQPGDTLAQVESLLGRGAAPHAEGREKLLTVTRAFAARRPAGYPDGVRDDDQFALFQIRPSGGLYLQFREGRLVNFVREDFREYRPPS